MRLKIGICFSILLHLGIVALLLRRQGSSTPVQIEPVSVQFVESEGHHAEQKTQLPKVFGLHPKSKKESSAANEIPDVGIDKGKSQSSAELGLYVSQIVQLLQDHKIYPKSALDREQEGDVLLSVQVFEDGETRNPLVLSPSSFAILDQAALKTLEQVGHFPNPPKGSILPLQLTIPFHFRIEHH